MEKLTKEKLLWFFYYDRENGKLYWKNHWAANAIPRWVGKEAGCIENRLKGGYRRVNLEGKRILVHRIIYFLETNTWPDIVDHINGDTLNNHVSNLRASTNTKNQNNRKRHREGKLVGAHLRGDKPGYESTISINKKRYRLGFFDTELEAHQAYMKKAKELGVL